MKKNARKVLAVFMAILMIVPLAMPAMAAATQPVWNTVRNTTVPVISIFGDGESIHDKDGNKLLEYRDLLNNIGGSDDEGDDNELLQSVINCVMPFLVQGLGTGNYQPYYDALEKEIGELFEGLLLDNNGEASDGSQVNPEKQQIMAVKRHQDVSNGGKNNFDLNSYIFWYDWRLDPIYIADELHAYINDIKEATGATEVSIACRCLGTSVVTAYVEKYGMDGIRGIGFDGGVVNGSELISETISGKFSFDADAINRFLIDCDALYMFSVDDFVNETIDMLSKAGIFDAIVGVTKEKIYYTVVKGITSALALSTFFTFPSYWAAVKAEDYETAKEYVFGPEGSEKRQKYAGLIEKIDNYDEVVRKNIPEIMKEIDDNGNLCVIAKYGVQLVPFVKSMNIVGDQFSTVTSASYGATTSTIYDTLSDEYIAQRVSEGKGKYISPDKQIDASTCMYPDQTWFVKGANHSDWTDAENRILYNVIVSDKQLTVDDSPYSQYFNAIRKKNSKGVVAAAAYDFAVMDETNCDCYYWEADYKADNATGNERIFHFVLSLINWLLSVIEMLFLK